MYHVCVWHVCVWHRCVWHTPLQLEVWTIDADVHADVHDYLDGMYCDHSDCMCCDDVDCTSKGSGLDVLCWCFVITCCADVMWWCVTMMLQRRYLHRIVCIACGVMILIGCVVMLIECLVIANRTGLVLMYCADVFRLYLLRMHLYTYLYLLMCTCMYTCIHAYTYVRDHIRSHSSSEIYLTRTRFLSFFPPVPSTPWKNYCQ